MSGVGILVTLMKEPIQHLSALRVVKGKRQMDNRLKIGVDVDGVLADFAAAFKVLLIDMYGVDHGEPVDFDWTNWGLSREQIDAAWERIKATQSFWFWLPPMADFRDVQHLEKETVVYYITARVPTIGMSAEKQTAAFLNDAYKVHFPTVIVSHEKDAIAKALHLDYFIDDLPKNCLRVGRTIGFEKVYLHNASHNQTLIVTDDAGYRLNRVNNFKEFVNVVLFSSPNSSSPNHSQPTEVGSVVSETGEVRLSEK